MPRQRLRRPRPPFGADARGKRYVSRFGLAIECADEREQRRLYRRLRQLGLEPKVLVI